MTEEEAQKELEKLTQKYLCGSPDYDKLIDVIYDKSRPGLPVRGILERISKVTSKGFTENEKDLISELIYLYG